MVIKMNKTTTSIKNATVNISVYNDNRISFCVFPKEGNAYYISVDIQDKKDKQLFNSGYVCSDTLNDFVYTKTELLD